MKRITTAMVAFALTVSVLASAPPVAADDPVAEKKAEAERIARELDQLSRRASMLTEELNVARLEAQRVEREASEAALAAARAEAETELARARLRDHAVQAYMSGGYVSLAGGLNVVTATDVVQGQAYMRLIAKDKAEAIEHLRAATVEFREKQAELDRTRLQARQALDAVDARRGDAAGAVAAERRTLARVNGELAVLVDAERQRRAAEEARKAQEDAARRARDDAARRPTPTPAPPQPSGGSGGGAAKPPAPAKPVAPTTPPPPPPSGASGAVEEAKKHLGKPYQYGGSGPDTFDCSGLTSWAWRHGGGKSLPHSSRAQYSSTTRVALDDIAPGDLLFYGPNVEGIHHVAIYVGGGQMIEAPETGKNVRYASIHRRDMVGIGRVR